MKKVLASLICALLCWPTICATEPADSLSCKINPWRSATSAASSLVINAAATELIKDNVNSMRPDRSDNHSFPSRHSSYAFTLASIATMELSRFSPFWFVAVQTAANAVALQRVFASRHYPSDVLAGAALGVASTSLGYALSSVIFPSHCRVSLPSVDNSSYIAASTTALLALSSHSRDGLSVGCGIESSISAGCPISDSWGFGGSFGMRSHPVYSDGLYLANLNGAALRAVTYYRCNFSRWSLQTDASIGALYNFDRPHNELARWSAVFDLSASAERQIARGLTIGPTLGIDVANRPSSWVEVSIALVTRASF